MHSSANAKTGEEPFVFHETDIGLVLADFWSWGFSNLLSNTLRGELAEFIVAVALGVEVRGAMKEKWAAYDLLTPEGIKVEVKSSAYVQGWEQDKLSSIRFDIGAKADGGRPADVYVFCLLAEQDRLRVSPLDLNQWEFYVLPTRVLAEQCAEKRTIALLSLMQLEPETADFSSLASAVRRVANT